MKSIVKYLYEGFKLNSSNANSELKILEDNFGDDFQIREKRTGNYELLYKDEVDNICKGCRKYDINSYTIRVSIYQYSNWGVSSIIKSCNNMKEVVEVFKKYLEKRNKKGLR